MNFKKCSALVISAALLAVPAYADGFGVYEVSARGVGMGGAMMFSDEASVMAVNPAAITQFDRRGTFSGAVTYISPRGTAEFLDDSGDVFLSQHNKNDPAYVPSLFYAKQVADNGWFGIGLFCRFGLKASYDPGWYGRYSNRSADFTTVSIAPTYAFKLAPNFSVGVGAELMYAKLVFDKSLSVYGMEAPMDLDADSWGWGWNIGFNWKVTPKLSIAALYRSEVKQDFDGDVNLSTSSLLGTDVNTTGNGHVHLPESYTFGIGWQFDEKTRMELDIIKTEWSSYDQLAFDVAIPSSFSPYASLLGWGSSYSYVSEKNWSDGWRYQFGIERRVNDRWSIRCGFVWDECSSENSETADYMVPTGTRRTYTFGFSYRPKANVEYSFGYGYMTVGDKYIYDHGAYNSRAVKSDAHIISIGMRMDF